MANRDLTQKAGQAAIELAVFGAILIFVLGSIIRSAVSNSYTQDQNFKAMRQALLSSWEGSTAKPPDLSRNSASVLFLDDRLSPEFDKYGSTERTPYVASGAGSFSYMLFYPIDKNEVNANLPVMDIYIDGQHFPLTTAAFHKNVDIVRPISCDPTDQQCLRLRREWHGGYVTAAELDSLIDTNGVSSGFIEDKLEKAGYISQITGSSPIEYKVDPGFSSLSEAFKQQYLGTGRLYKDNGWFPDIDTSVLQAQFKALNTLLKENKKGYRLFYTMAANGTKEFFKPGDPPTCNMHPCSSQGKKNRELSANMILAGESPSTCFNGNLSQCNEDLHLEFDLNRDGVYKGDPHDPQGYMQNDIAWQWTATAGLKGHVGVDHAGGVYPSYDVDGDLKEETVYNIKTCTAKNQDQLTNDQGQPCQVGDTVIDYLDYQDGDIDSTYDSLSRGPKPGLLQDFTIYTFDQNGTYMQINEGTQSNPETQRTVRSGNRRHQVELIQHIVQLSNDTGRFCKNGQPVACVGDTFICTNGKKTCSVDKQVCADPDPNPVEYCYNGQDKESCFSPDNIKKTCFDEITNRLYVRARVKDVRGSSWITNNSGELKIR